METELRDSWFKPAAPQAVLPRDPLADLYEELLSPSSPLWLTPAERAKLLPPEVRTRLAALRRELDLLRKKPPLQVEQAVVVQDGQEAVQLSMERITASDAPSNPAPLALTGDKESLPFEVDNTPPTVTVTLISRSPVRLRAVAKDDSSLIRRAEYSVDGGRWDEVHPTDGINDSREETYEISLDALSGPGPHIVVVRASDQLGNVSTARVEVP